MSSRGVAAFGSPLNLSVMPSRILNRGMVMAGRRSAGQRVGSARETHRLATVATKLRCYIALSGELLMVEVQTNSAILDRVDVAGLEADISPTTTPIRGDTRFAALCRHRSRFSSTRWCFCCWRS